MHADIQQALHYNRLIVVVAPVLVFVWVGQLLSLVRFSRQLSACSGNDASKPTAT
jgi:hypothetical protein